MSVDLMRDKIAAAYDSWRWRERVSKMSDNQVIAIYFNFKKSGKFEEMKRKHKTDYRQMTIFDYIH